MLVVSRKLGEKVWIGPDICVMLTSIDRNKGRLGIAAPPHVEILREELLPPDDPRRQNPLKHLTAAK